MKTKDSAFTIDGKAYCTAGEARKQFGIKPGRLSKLVSAGEIKRYSFPLLIGYPLYSLEQLTSMQEDSLEQAGLKTDV